MVDFKRILFELVVVELVEVWLVELVVDTFSELVDNVEVGRVVVTVETIVLDFELDSIVVLGVVKIGLDELMLEFSGVELSWAVRNLNFSEGPCKISDFSNDLLFSGGRLVDAWISESGAVKVVDDTIVLVLVDTVVSANFGSTVVFSISSFADFLVEKSIFTLLTNPSSTI